MNPSVPGDSRGPAPAQPGLLRNLNSRVVLDLLIEHDTLSRSDVRTLTGLSKRTGSLLLQRLEEKAVSGARAGSAILVRRPCTAALGRRHPSVSAEVA